MLRTALFTAALVAATSNASAHGGDYTRTEVIRSGPSVSVSVGSVRRDGYRFDYDSGGTYSTIRERGRYVAPAPVVVVPVAVPRSYGRDDYWRDDRRHWRDDHRHWRGNHHRHGWGHRYDD
jgi:hypothetical protein